MNELIQIIKILEKEEVDKLNAYIDTLHLQGSTVFGKGTKQDTSSGRTSTGTTLNENYDVTLNLHNKINDGLVEYKRRVEKIHRNFGYYPVMGYLLHLGEKEFKFYNIKRVKNTDSITM